MPCITGLLLFWGELKPPFKDRNMAKDIPSNIQEAKWQNYRIRMVIEDDKLCELNLVPAGSATVSASKHPYVLQVMEYLQGLRDSWNIPLKLRGTEFQKSVWHHLLSIPYGTTISYQDLAKAIGRPTAVRAVASAVAKNPVWLICPCHRVIRSNGALGGYAGGIPLKTELLKLEQKGRFAK